MYCISCMLCHLSFILYNVLQILHPASWTIDPLQYIMELIFCILNIETFSPILCILLCIRYAISLYIFNLHPAFYIFYPLFWVFYSISYILYPISYFFSWILYLYISFSQKFYHNFCIPYIDFHIIYIFLVSYVLPPISCILYLLNFFIYQI